MNKQKVHRWADARVETPASFQTSIDRTLKSLKEEKPMKKNVVRTILLAALIVALLLGTAYAVVSFTGILDTYHTKPLDGTEAFVQNDFGGAVYENEWYSVRVREALTDGITARVMLEYTAKDANALLVAETEDEDVAFEIDGALKRFNEWAKGRSHVVCVGLPNFLGIDANGSFGNEEHISPTQLLVWYEFKTGDALNAPLGVSEAWRVDGGEWQFETQIPEGDTCRYEAAWFITLKNAVCDIRTVKLESAEAGILHLSNITFTFSPIYTYADYTLRVDGLDAVKAAHATHYADFYAMDGTQVTSGGGYGALADENGAYVYHEQLEAMTDIPKELTLKYTQINEDENGSKLNTIEAAVDIPLR